MSSFMLGFLTMIIFLAIGFAIGLVSAFAYYLFHNRPVKRYQFAEPADRQVTIRRQVPLDGAIRTGIDGDTALSNFNSRK